MTQTLSNQICHRLYVLSHAVTRAYRPLLDAIDLTYPQYLVLLALWEQNHLDIGTLQAKTQIDAGALSLIIKKLTTKSYIITKASDQDQRIKIASLTQTGQKLQMQAAKIPEALSACFPDVTKEDTDNLKAALDMLMTKMHQNET